MKPFGLTNPHDPQTKAYAVVQLRQDNKLGTLFNMVDSKPKLKHGEQTRVFRTIPGLGGAEFARLGGLHRNTFSIRRSCSTPSCGLLPCHGCASPEQITGCEGYVESAAIGLLAGHFAAAERRGEVLAPPRRPPRMVRCSTTLPGGHIQTIDAGRSSYQPMNVTSACSRRSRARPPGTGRHPPARSGKDARKTTRHVRPGAR